MYTLVNGRIQTRSLEVHIVDHCNLRCRGCCSLSPFLPKWQIDLNDFQKDLVFAKRVLSPTYFKLVGGEPLLHTSIDDCLKIAKQCKIADVVSVTTNGFLLPRMSDHFWTLTEALTISLYPEPALPRETIGLIEQKADLFSVKLNWKKQDQFVDMDRESPMEDSEVTREVYANCWLRRRCHIVSRGRFFTCTRPPHFQTLHGGTKDFLNDGVELENASAEQILAYLNRPQPLQACAFCRGGNAETAPHRQLNPREVKAFLARQL